MYRRGELGQVARALRVLDALRGFKRGRRVKELAGELGISERTVRRDLAELQEAGYDLEITYREGDGAAVASLLTERTTTPISITKRERFTLLAMRRVFDVLPGTPFLEDVRSVYTKLEQRMSERERADLAAFGDLFVYQPDHGTKSYAGKEDIIDAIQTGMMARKVVRYRYADARGRARAGYLVPLGLVLYRHGLYVVAARLKTPDATPTTANVGTFAIERFVEAEHLRAHEFTRPVEFTLTDFVQGSFGPHLPDPDGPHDVLVEFTPRMAPYVTSRTWHDSQRTETQPDGSVRVSLRVAALAPVGSWVLEWGPEAVVLAPPKLVAMIADDAHRLAGRYSSSLDSSG